MTTIETLSYVVYVATWLLMALKLWNWHDTHTDWVIVRDVEKRAPETAIYKQAKGFLTLAVTRVLDGFFFLVIGHLTWLNRHQVPAYGNGLPDWIGRAIMIGIIGMEMVKLAIDRHTRIEVYNANK